RKRQRDRLRALGLRQVEARPAQHHEARRTLAPVDPRQQPPAQDRAGDEVPPSVLAQTEPVPRHATRQVAARRVEQTALFVAQHFLPRLSHAISLTWRSASSRAASRAAANSSASSFNRSYCPGLSAISASDRSLSIKLS